MFSKQVITRTLAGEEPMVILDSAALTQRIGRITRPEKQPEPQLELIAKPVEPPQPKWRSYLRARS